MRDPRCRCLFLAALLSLPLRFPSASTHASEPAPGEIVVVNRYLQQSGESHAHLYLYREDGKLLRQLTNDERGQDETPVFAPDGETIVFTRELPDHTKQCWSIEPRGGNLHGLPAAPDWYTSTQSSPSFNGNSGVEGTNQRAFPTPDGHGEVQLIPAPDEDPQDIFKWIVRLRTGDHSQPVELGRVEGSGTPDLLSCPAVSAAPCFLREGAWTVAFCEIHRDSTDGSSLHAIDLGAKRFVELSANGALAYPLPGEAAFLSSTSERYTPFGDGKRTANCNYVDRWDPTWQRIRYSREKAPAANYGASMYRPGRTPTVITIRGVSE